MTKERVSQLENYAKILRRNVVEMIGAGKTGHIGGSLSSADIVAMLYFEKMKINPENFSDIDRDRFLLSKGHAALVQYAALGELGYFDKSEFKNLKKLNSLLQGHPDINKTNGVEANTGSLGQGLSIAVGMALGNRLNNIDRRVYVILGDGELAEGQVWEGAMAAANFKLDSITVIVDQNKIQAMGRVVDRFDTNPLPEKWSAFGFNVIKCNGHDMGQLSDAFDNAKETKGKPSVIIADTIKGKGLSFAEGVVSYHNGMMSQEQFELALKELA